MDKISPGLSFIHPFLELCISLCSSPLKTNAPFLAQFLMLVIASGCKYVAELWNTDLIGAVLSFAGLVLDGKQFRNQTCSPS